jgi:hypothetical protein
MTFSIRGGEQTARSEKFKAQSSKLKRSSSSEAPRNNFTRTLETRMAEAWSLDLF